MMARSEQLDNMSREELVLLVGEMLDRQPSLDYLVARPRPGFHPIGVPIDPISYRKELAQARSSYGEFSYGQGNYYEISSTPLGRLASAVALTAAGFAAHGDWPNAALLYEVILQECLAIRRATTNYSRDWREAIELVFDGLAQALQQPVIQADEAQRKAALFGLLNLLIWQIDQIAVPLPNRDPEATFLGFVHPQDVAQIRSALLHALRTGNDRARGGFERLLLQLDLIDEANPELALANLRERGLYLLVVSKLLRLHRLDEALAVIEEYLCETRDLLQALDLLSQSGYYEIAFAVAERALRMGVDAPLESWMLQESERQGDAFGRLRVYEIRMAQYPSEFTFELLARQAERLGKWQALRSQVVERIMASGNKHLLVLAYLYDQDWDLAWETLDGMDQEGTDQELDLIVAQRSRTACPLKAIPVYMKYVLQHVGRGTRPHYHEAAKLLKTVRAMYRKLKRMSEWTEIIGNLREEYKRRSALMDELSRAKL